MSLNEGTNFTLTACVTYRAPDSVSEKVEAILEQANTEIQAIFGACSRLKVTDVHEDCERHDRYMTYLSQFMTDEQMDELHNI